MSLGNIDNFLMVCYNVYFDGIVWGTDVIPWIGLYLVII